MGNGSGNSPPGGIDAGIADLLGIEIPTGSPGSLDSSDLPAPEESAAPGGIGGKAFVIPTKLQRDSPNPIFLDKDYYKKTLAGEGDAARKVHSLLGQFLNTEDSGDRSTFRTRLVTAYWDLTESIIKKLSTESSFYKRGLIRYGLLLPGIISPEQLKMLSLIPDSSESPEPFYYADEWLAKIARGQIGPSATDELKKRRPPNKTSGDTSNTPGNREKVQEQRQIQIGIIRDRLADQENCESALADHLLTLRLHAARLDFPDLKEGYTAEQRRALSEMGNCLRELSSIDKELTQLYLSLEAKDAEFQALKEEVGQGEGEEPIQVNSSEAVSEFNTLKKMAKLCVGRQGNHFPFLMKQYFRSALRDVATRENVILKMDQVEKLDPGVFNRTFKQETTRIVPFVLLLASFGERGICWEPFDKYNRSTSRGRIAIPLYPKNLLEAVVYALGDFRWQVAKEKAQHRWMEEGLTGYYYQWFSAKKKRGDIKASFIQDYYLWITKESEGTQKLDKEVRGVFWRYLPFPEKVRKTLRNCGYVYDQLYKKDINRSLSDGY